MDEKKESMVVDGVGDVKVKFPSNSHKSAAKQGGSRKVEKVIRGNVVTRKKSLGKRITETFLGDDINNVFSYITHEVLLPAAKSTISDMVSGGIERLLFGEVRSSRNSRDRGRSYVSYSNYYKGNRDERSTSRNRARHNFDDIILETRGEAEEVLGHLVDIIEEYGVVSVADLYALVDIAGNFTDNKYGWENLSRATVSRVRDGYLIDLPKPILID